MGKIDLSKLKDLMKGLGGLRVYLVLIWPAVILLACGAVLTAAWLMGSSLKQKANRESVPMGNLIKGMLKSSHAAGQVEVEKRYQDEYQQDANLIKLLSVESAQRELLSYDIFPQPKDTSTLLFTRFGDRFRQGVEGLIAKVRGGDCPGAEELEIAKQTGSSPGSSRLSGGGGVSASSRIVEGICNARAKSVSVYAEPEAVSGYDFWKTYQYSNIDDSVKDCWFWQVGYWIIEDVFSTAGKMNAGSSSVFTSPVKRVERVGFVTPDALFGAGSGKASRERPKYVTKPDEQLTESFTGRVSNEDIDVVHFSMVVVLSSKAIIPFMRELCSAKEHKFMGYTGQEPAKVFKHNQITILESRVKPVDLMSPDHQYYRYGSDSVVEVEFVCEYIFNKKGYDAVKPELIKNPVAKTGISGGVAGQTHPRVRSRRRRIWGFRTMIRKQSNFIDEHIEKVALVIGGLLAIYVLYAFALRGPELIYDNQKFRPGQLDIYIAEQSEKLKERLAGDPIPKPPYVPQSVRFLAKINSVLDKDLNVLWPVPSSVETMVNKKYRMPVIGSVNDVFVEHIGAVAYVPKVAITTENAKLEETYEPNDLDLVTVQASFDLAPLIDSFQECFAGKDVPEGWRDTGLARPIFAAVRLQRQCFGDNGEWGQWEDVPRVKTDPKRDDYKIIEDVNGLPSGGVMVQLAKFSDPEIQVKLLQPEPYKIASAEDDWLPPLLHGKYLTVRREKETQDRRETIATEREAKAAEERDRTLTRPAREERTTPDRTRSAAGRTPPGRGTGGGGGGDRSPAGETDRSGASRNPSRTTTRPDRTEQSRDRRTETTMAAEQKKAAKPAVTEATINEEMKKMLLTKKDISSLRETVTFWAYDDTVEPGASYQYRIRLGVFNPVAGTSQVREEDAENDSKVILWSGFSDVTDVVAIPKRLYFFPVNVQEAARAVEVQVCKYVLGYWHSEQFMVKRGDVIGRVAKAKVEPSDKDKSEDVKLKLPEMIDYATGAVVVDVVAMNDWFGDKTLQSRQYFDMLFSFDGTSVERLPAKQMYWPEELRLKYSELKTLEKKPKEPWRAWSSTGVLEGQQRAVPGDGMRRGPMDRGGQMEDNMPRRGPPQ